MILIFDTSCGLCNQFFDIQAAINYCNLKNYYFSFRNCSFREDDVKLFKFVPFNKLFDEKNFQKFDNYYQFDKIKEKINDKNTFNYKCKRTIELFKDEKELTHFLKNMTHEFIILPQFFSISKFQNHFSNYYIKIKPNPKLYSIYLNLKKNILPKKYNFLHFRYEKDFTSYFNINYILSIDSLLNRLNYKDNDLKIYIACSDIKKISKTLYLCNDVYSYKNIIFKDDYFKKYNIHNLNFEEKAFIDFLIGINSQEIYGHSKSSFSGMINMFKNTKNYYD